MAKKAAKPEFFTVKTDASHKKQAMALAKKRGLSLAAFLRTILYERLDEETSKAA